jgi:hypothetical protein
MIPRLYLFENNEKLKVVLKLALLELYHDLSLHFSLKLASFQMRLEYVSQADFKMQSGLES